MKRIIIISLVCCLVISFFTFGVSATSDFKNDYWLDITSDVGISGDGSNVILVSKLGTSITNTINLNRIISYSGFDMVISTDGDLNSVSINSDLLTLTEVSDGLYRAYGGTQSWSSTLRLTIRYSNCTYINIEYLGVLTSTYTYLPALAAMEVSHAEFDTGLYQEFGYETLRVNFQDYVNDTTESINQPQSFVSAFWAQDWYKYDYLEFCISSVTDGIDSIYVMQNDMMLDYEVSYIESSSDDVIYDSSNTYDSVHIYPQYNYFLVRVDLTDCIRGTSTNLIPKLYVSGKYYFWGTDSPAMGDSRSIACESVVGYVRSSVTDSAIAIWTGIKNSISYISSLLGDYIGNIQDEDKIDIDSSSDQIKNDIGEMQWEDKPNMDDFDPNGTIDDSGADLQFIAEFFLQIYDIPFIKYGMWISLSFAAAAFVIF